MVAALLHAAAGGRKGGVREELAVSDVDATACVAGWADTLSKLAFSDSDATGTVAKRWKTCVLGFFMRQMLLQALLDLVRQLLLHLNPSMQVFPLRQHLSQMKSETASFPSLCNSFCRISATF